MQNVLCARLYFHIQIVNQNWTTNVTTLDSKNSTPMEMKSMGRNRDRDRGRRYFDVLSDTKFDEVSVAGVEKSVL